MNYQHWEATVPQTITADPLWTVRAYKLALFIGDIGWHDVSKLMKDRRTISLADQLYRSLGSISANLAEGYSRGSNKDRARFYEYSLGSARESRDWYFKGRYIFGENVVQHRLDLLSEIIRLLLTMIPQQRRRTLQEHNVSYQTKPFKDSNQTSLDNLLQKIPFSDM